MRKVGDLMDLGPRIYGLRLAAGVVIWVFSGLLAAGAAVTILGSLTSGGLELYILVGGTAIAVAFLAIAAGFWRGNRVARWLAVFPALGIFFGAFVWWALSGICTSGAPMPGHEPSVTDALSRVEPMPPRSLLSWLGTAVLAGSGAVVLIGMFRPGRYAEEGPEQARGRTSDLQEERK